jgi:hypothetical protein
MKGWTFPLGDKFHPLGTGTNFTPWGQVHPWGLGVKLRMALRPSGFLKSLEISCRLIHCESIYLPSRLQMLILIVILQLTQQKNDVKCFCYSKQMRKALLSKADFFSRLCASAWENAMTTFSKIEILPNRRKSFPGKRFFECFRLEGSLASICNHWPPSRSLRNDWLDCTAEKNGEYFFQTAASQQNGGTDLPRVSFIGAGTLQINWLLSLNKNSFTSL